MSEALTGHEMLNHLGVTIRVSQGVIRFLDMRNYLFRDMESGLLAMKPQLFPVLREMEPLDVELGPDMSGPSSLSCKCRECLDKLAEMDRTKRPGRDPYDDFVTSEIVADVKAKRMRA
jgi:hypothetical protein